MKVIRDEDILCPFTLGFCTHCNSMYCEGMTEDSIIRHMFDDSEALTRHVEKYCAGHFEGCPAYAMLSSVSAYAMLSSVSE